MNDLRFAEVLGMMLIREVHCHRSTDMALNFKFMKADIAVRPILHEELIYIPSALYA